VKGKATYRVLKNSIQWVTKGTGLQGKEGLTSMATREWVKNAHDTFFEHSQEVATLGGNSLVLTWSNFGVQTAVLLQKEKGGGKTWKKLCADGGNNPAGLCGYRKRNHPSRKEMHASQKRAKQVQGQPREGK